VHVELTPGIVTILPAWKLDAFYCTGLKVGAPQVSLAALCALHELLVACESRLDSADGNIVTQEAQDGIAATARRKEGACSEAEAYAPDSTTPVRPRSRRRSTSGHDTGAAPSCSQDWRICCSRRAASQRRRPAMTTHDALLPATVLQRKAIVYVRQSTPQQVQTNLESQRRQYELVDVARRRGFTKVEIIDDDLGRSASGAVDRPGFDRLVAAPCAGQVGAVLCLDASRLARNGRDWHHLLELCGLVDARVIDWARECARES
jgi:hypothetical protein